MTFPEKITRKAIAAAISELRRSRFSSVHEARQGLADVVEALPSAEELSGFEQGVFSAEHHDRLPSYLTTLGMPEQVAQRAVEHLKRTDISATVAQAGGVGPYLHRLRAGTGHSVAEIAADDGKYGATYQQMHGFEKGRLPGPRATVAQAAFQRYAAAIGLDEDAQMQLYALHRTAHASQTTPVHPRAGKTLAAKDDVEERRRRVRAAYDQYRSAPVDSLNGRPAKHLTKLIEEVGPKGPFGYGLLLGEAEGRDWIREMLMPMQNTGIVLSLDEIVSMTVMVSDMYRGIADGMQKTIDSLKAEATPEKRRPGYLWFGVGDTENPSERQSETHMLSNLEPSATALDLKLDMFEKGGYASARLARTVLKEQRTRYERLYREGFEMAQSDARELRRRATVSPSGEIADRI